MGCLLYTSIMVDIVVNHAGYGTESTFADMLRAVSYTHLDVYKRQLLYSSSVRCCRMARCCSGIW